jgi:transcriptional regulator with XRE-family HTH domain
MSRFHQRLREHMQDPEFASGYWEMDSELQLIQAIDTIRQREGLTTEELARRMDRERAFLSRLFNAEHPNPTIDTFTALLKALNVTAEVHLRHAQEGEPPLKVSVDEKVSA